MKLQAAGEKFTDQEREGLSDAELEVLDGEDTSEEDLAKIAADADDDADDADETGTEEEKVAAAKAKEEAEAKAKEAAEAKAAAAAEAKAKADAEAKIKAAADAAADAAKKAGADAEAQKKAREDAETKARAEAKAAVVEGEEEEVDAGADTTTAGTDEELEDDDPFLAPYVAPKPENYDARVKELDTRHDAAAARFQKGEEGYELKDMLAEQRGIERERRELDAQMERHRTTAELAEKAGERHWLWEVNRFMRDVKKHEGIDYADSIRLNAAFDAEVKRIANLPENAEKTGRWFLTEAHKTVKAKLKLGTAAPAPKDGADAKAAAAAAAKVKADADAKAKAAALAKRKGDPTKLPKTLGSLPSAGGVDLGKDGEGEFAEVNALLEAGDSLKAEAYIAGKSAEWQDRWARHSG